VHWAFDQGIFTISDQYEVILHPKAKIADFKAFPLISADRKQIKLPTDSAYYPHQEALAWHRENRFGVFTKMVHVKP
jgi:putative restriction endonuclease